MARDTVSEWSEVPSENVTVAAVNLGEFPGPNAMIPPDINNALRTIMAQVKTDRVKNPSPNISQYKTSGNTTEDAIALMAAEYGFVVFPVGSSPIASNITINVPSFFNDGAYLTVASTFAVTFTSRIISGKQWIFRGAGLIYLNIVNPDGEDSKNAHISWWGVFPRGNATDILTAQINKAFSAYSLQNREGTMEFDNGSYRIDGTITVPRGVWLKGSGTRRTIFDLVGAGFTAIASGGDAVRITGIQFEQPSDMEAAFAGTQIDLLHNDAFLDDISLWSCDVGIRVRGNQANISRVRATYNNITPGAGTATIWLQGSRATVDDVKVVGTSNGPESIVLIGKGNASSISQNIVTRVTCTEASIPINIIADVGNVNLTNISNVSFLGDSAITGGAVTVVTSGSASVVGLVIDSLMASSTAGSLLSFTQGSSGTSHSVTLGNSVIYGAGNGVVLTRTAGTLRSITVGDGVNVKERTIPVAMTGVISGLALPSWLDASRLPSTVGVFDSRDAAALLNLSAYSVVEIKRWSTVSPLAPAKYEKVAQPGNVEPTHAAKFQDTNGVWFGAVSALVSPETFGALRGRANAATTVTAINAMTRYCEITGAAFDLLGGTWFINDTWEILAPVQGRGRGIGYWHTYAPAFNNGKSQAAQTQIVLTGTGPTSYRPHGMTSMRVSGGVVANPSARVGWNEAEYSLTNLNVNLSIGLFIDVAAWGSDLSGFRIVPDGGGDDGMDLYNDETATAATGWAADWDVGIWADATRKLIVRDVQAVGHFRIAGKISAAIPMDATIQPPPAPYEQFWENCDFGGWRATAVRGADTFQITGIGADYVEIDYSADHPFDPAFTTYFALSTNSFSHTAATFTGLSILGATLRLTGVSPNPDTSFNVGDSIVARLFGGGTSQLHHTNCRIHGMIHPSGRQCHDQALGANAMPHPGTAVEISGHRLVEVIFDNHCSIQSGEQVAYHIHDAGEIFLTDLVEFNTDIVGNTRGMRMITSPTVATNTRVTHPCGVTARPCFGDGGLSNLLNNNGPSGCLDLRPAIDIPPAAFALFTADSGFLSASNLRIPALSLYEAMNGANGLRTPKAGIAGIFGDTYPTPLAKFVYDAAQDILVSSEHIKPDTTNIRDLGDATKVFRGVYGRTVFIGDGAARIASGTGSPAGVVSAPVGSLYLRLDGGATTTLYVKEAGTSSTGWVAK